MVTVTFSHHGEFGSSAPADGVLTAEAVVAAATPPAEMSAKAAIARNTALLLRARRSGGLIAAANLPRLTRNLGFVSVSDFCGARHTARRTPVRPMRAPESGGAITDKEEKPRVRGEVPGKELAQPTPETEMGAGIAASPHCAERRICRCS